VAVRGWPKSLTWHNFRVVQSAPPDETEDAQIEASMGAPAQVKVRPDGDHVRLGSFDVNVEIVQHGTWVVRGKSTASLLSHEQGHWDIAGLSAHEYHRALEAVRASDQSELAQLVQEALERAQKKVDGLQEKYDRETNHSRDSASQARWSTLIRDCIMDGNRALPDP
jgi:hypothetical protein